MKFCLLLVFITDARSRPSWSQVRRRATATSHRSIRPALWSQQHARACVGVDCASCRAQRIVDCQCRRVAAGQGRARQVDVVGEVEQQRQRRCGSNTVNRAVCAVCVDVDDAANACDIDHYIVDCSDANDNDNDNDNDRYWRRVCAGRGRCALCALRKVTNNRTKRNVLKLMFLAATCLFVVVFFRATAQVDCAQCAMIFCSGIEFFYYY